MARVHTAKAAKDYPEHGIVKGQLYYHWAAFRGPKQMSATPPRPSQVTSNSKLSALYSATESLEDALREAANLDDIQDALDQCASEVGEVIDEYRESISNMEETFTGGSPLIDEFTENADALEAFADELNEASEEVRAMPAEDYIDHLSLRERVIKMLCDETEGWPETDAIDARCGIEANKVFGFDDLTEDEQAMMLDAARDIACGPSCPL